LDVLDYNKPSVALEAFAASVAHQNKNMHLRSRSSFIESIREIIFGLEDSLVSTMGAVTGIAVGTENRTVVILSGIVILAVEATSMAAGSFLSTESAELMEKKTSQVAHRRSFKASLTMFVSYLSGGILPLVPYFLLPTNQAVVPSIVLTVLALALVGLWAGKITGRAPWKAAAEMAGVSLLAAAIGYLIGWAVPNLFGIDIKV